MARILDCVCGGETTEPVADPVRVTCPDESGDAGLDDGGKFGAEVAGVCGGGSLLECFFCDYNGGLGKWWVRTVTGVGEALAGVVGAFLVGTLCANGLLHTCLCQVVAVGFRGVRVVARRSDVIDIKVCNAA